MSRYSLLAVVGLLTASTGCLLPAAQPFDTLCSESSMETDGVMCEECISTAEVPDACTTHYEGSTFDFECMFDDGNETVEIWCAPEG